MLAKGLRRGLTVQEAAKLLQFHPEAVRYWLRVGELRGTRLEPADDWLVEPDDLLAFLRQNDEPFPWSVPVVGGGDARTAFTPAH